MPTIEKMQTPAPLNDMHYIVIKDKILVYQMTRYDKATNAAHLTLYKNPDTFRANMPFKEIEVADWQ